MILLTVTDLGEDNQNNGISNSSLVSRKASPVS